MTHEIFKQLKAHKKSFFPFCFSFCVIFIISLSLGHLTIEFKLYNWIGNLIKKNETIIGVFKGSNDQRHVINDLADKRWKESTRMLLCQFHVELFTWEFNCEDQWETTRFWNIRTSLFLSTCSPIFSRLNWKSFRELFLHCRK